MMSVLGGKGGVNCPLLLLSRSAKHSLHSTISSLSLASDDPSCFWVSSVTAILARNCIDYFAGGIAVTFLMCFLKVFHVFFVWKPVHQSFMLVLVFLQVSLNFRVLTHKCIFFALSFLHVTVRSYLKTELGIQQGLHFLTTFFCYISNRILKVVLPLFDRC